MTPAVQVVIKQGEVLKIRDYSVLQRNASAEVNANANTTSVSVDFDAPKAIYAQGASISRLQRLWRPWTSVVQEVIFHESVPFPAQPMLDSLEQQGPTGLDFRARFPG